MNDDGVDVDLPYNKMEVIIAFDNIIKLATDQIEQDKVLGMESADDFISQKSLIIVEHVRDMITKSNE